MSDLAGREATVECVRCGVSVPWPHRMQVYDEVTKTVTAPLCAACFETRTSWRPE